MARASRKEVGRIGGGGWGGSVGCRRLGSNPGAGNRRGKPFPRLSGARVVRSVRRPMNPSASAPSPLNRTAWLICVIAAIGFAFDIYELLMLPLIIKPAMASLSAPLVEQLVAGGMERARAAALWSPGGEEYVKWARTLFFVPAIAGGVFGLLGGYLTDLLGRRRGRAGRGGA